MGVALLEGTGQEMGGEFPGDSSQSQNSEPAMPSRRLGTIQVAGSEIARKDLELAISLIQTAALLYLLYTQS